MKTKILSLAAVAGITLLSSALSYAGMTNFYCNNYNLGLVHGTDVEAGPGKSGVAIPIPTSCNENNVCKISLAINASGADPYSQNNNSQTSLMNGTRLSSDVFYAYSNNRSDATQCIFKDSSYLQLTGAVKVSAKIEQTGKSEQYWRDQEIQFN